MSKFVNVLVRLPNLRTLELLGVTRRTPVTKELKRKCASFPSIREMTVCSKYPDFIRACPNLESLTFRHCLVRNSSTALSSYGAELKRVRGVGTFIAMDVECEPRKCLPIRCNHSVDPSHRCGAELPETSRDLAFWWPLGMSLPPINGIKDNLRYTSTIVCKGRHSETPATGGTSFRCGALSCWVHGSFPIPEYTGRVEGVEDGSH